VTNLEIGVAPEGATPIDSARPISPGVMPGGFPPLNEGAVTPSNISAAQIPLPDSTPSSLPGAIASASPTLVSSTTGDITEGYARALARYSFANATDPARFANLPVNVPEPFSDVNINTPESPTS